MKKIIIILHLIVVLTCFVFNSIAIYIESADLDYLIISEVILGLGIFYSFKTVLEPNYYKGNLYLFIYNIIQIVAIGLLGFVYKVSYGPFIYFKIYKDTDWFIDMEFDYYSRIFYINATPPDDFFYLGINAIQLLFAFYFFKELKKEYGYIFMKNPLNDNK